MKTFRIRNDFSADIDELPFVYITLTAHNIKKTQWSHTGFCARWFEYEPHIGNHLNYLVASEQSIASGCSSSDVVSVRYSADTQR